MVMNHLDHEVLLHKDHHELARQWCHEQFGLRWNPLDNRSGRWAMFWAGRDRFDQYRFCFADKEDMLMFILRWGHE